MAEHLESQLTRKHITRWGVILLIALSLSILCNFAAIAKTGRVPTNAALIQKIINALQDNGMWSEEQTP